MLTSMLQLEVAEQVTGPNTTAGFITASSNLSSSAIRIMTNYQRLWKNSIVTTNMLDICIFKAAM